MVPGVAGAVPGLAAPAMAAPAAAAPLATGAGLKLAGAFGAGAGGGLSAIEALPPAVAADLAMAGPPAMLAPAASGLNPLLMKTLLGAGLGAGMGAMQDPKRRGRAAGIGAGAGALGAGIGGLMGEAPAPGRFPKSPNLGEALMGQQPLRQMFGAAHPEARLGLLPAMGSKMQFSVGGDRSPIRVAPFAVSRMAQAPFQRRPRLRPLRVDYPLDQQEGQGQPRQPGMLGQMGRYTGLSPLGDFTDLLFRRR